MHYAIRSRVLHYIFRSPPISRILSRTIIYLGCTSPCTSCGLPTASFAHRAGGTGGILGFAPGGVCRAVIVANDAVRSYRTLSPLPSNASARVGGLLSVALSVALPRPAVSWRPALWSSDFPRERLIQVFTCRGELISRDRLADSENLFRPGPRTRLGDLFFNILYSFSFGS